MGHSRDPRDLFAHLTRAVSDLAVAFQRKRRWSPRSVVIAVFLLTQPNQQTNYGRIFSDLRDEICRLFGWTAIPTASSLCVARGKVVAETFREVLHRLVADLEPLISGSYAHHTQRRFVAIDATSLVCPRSASTLKRLDRPHVTPWHLAHYPRAVVVVAVDVLRRLPLEWVLLPKGRGERAAGKPLVAQARPGDVLILDRGYPARWLLGDAVARGIDLVMRMTAAKAGAWKEVNDFLASGASTAVIQMPVDSGATVTVRLLRRNPPRGRPLKHQRRETMVILTTLLPRHGFEAKDIFDLYSKRWGIESLFREMKEAFALETFHARSVQGIEQEIAAVLMWIALTAAIHATVQAGLTDGKRANAGVSRSLARRCVEAAIEGRSVNLESMIIQARRSAYKPRPGRSFPRHSHLPYGRSRNRSVK